MTMPDAPLEPLRVVCNGCGATGSTTDYQHPDRAVACGCCLLDHDHSGECRPVTISATAVLIAEIF